MSEVQIFDHEEFGNVRSILMNGEAWFVVLDVCRILGIANPTDALTRVDGADLGTTEIRNERGELRSTKTVNESGLYDLIFQSRKPGAKAFRRWVTNEVLPSIRKTGGYGVVPGSYAAALRAHADAVELAEQAQKELEAAQPKLETYDAWLDTSEAIEMTDFAKRIGFTPAGRFTAALRDTGVLRKDKRPDNSFRNLPTAEWEDSFIVRSHQLPNGRWIDLALINSGGQLEVLEHLRDRGYEV